ncbi:MAG: hypothetical protein AB7Y46_02010 [Armatimonadota bacterium]
MRLCRSCLLLTALILLVLALPATAARTAFRYDAAQRVIKACVLGLAGQTSTIHPNPYVIEGLRRSDLVPDDWVFENPLAPATAVTGEVPGEYAVKGTREYWFVPLTDQTARSLMGMDLIYICAPELDLSLLQQEGLRAAVEAGAILWVDNDIIAGGTVWTAFPWVFEFADAGAGTYARVPLDRRHGLLTEPHSLSSTNVALLGDDPDWADVQAGTDAVSGLYITNYESIFRPVVQVGEIGGDGQVINREAFILAASYGSGSILLTTGGVGFDVAEWLGTGAVPPPGFTAGRRPSPDPTQAPDVRLALNAIQWNERWEQARRTPRAPATSIARAPFPLDIAWQFPEEGEPLAANVLGAVVSTPVYGRGMVYAVSIPTSAGMAPAAPAEIVCLDTDPEQSLDGDAWPDDGIADYGRGAGYDVVWRQPIGPDQTPRFAGPALASVMIPGSNGYAVPIQVVLVSSVDIAGTPAMGYVTCYNATIDGEILAQVPAPFNTPGAVLWRRVLSGYGGRADVVALSTPVVHNDFVYVLATEYDDTLAGTAPSRAYGRVHCFQLNFDWSGGDPDDAAWWVYPSSELDLDGDGTPAARPEEQRSLPPFYTPGWVATPAAARSPLPPAPGAIPVVHAAGGTVEGGYADALVTFGTPVTFRYSAGAGQVTLETQAGGSVFCVVPAPLVRSTGTVALNENYFLAAVNYDMLNDPADHTVLASDGTTLVPDEWYDIRHRRYRPGAVREAIAAGATDPLEGQLGVNVLIDYHLASGGTADDEPHCLLGPVRWRLPLPVGDRIEQPVAMVEDEMVVVGGWPISYPAPPGPTSGGFMRLEASSGGTLWRYDPVASMPMSIAGSQSASLTAAAFDEDTVVVGATTVNYPNSVVASSVMGLQRQMEPVVRLRGPNPAAGYGVSLNERSPIRVTVVATGMVISPVSYRVDHQTRYLTFPAETAGQVKGADGSLIGPIYGRMISVDWTHDNGTPTDYTDDVAVTGEVHVVPDIERFQHTYGFIRLHNRPVDWTAGSEPVIMRADGTVVPPALYAPWGGVTTIGGRDLLRGGWIALDPSIGPGEELLVSYTGWSERDGGFLTIPDPARNLGLERHVTAEQFGPSLSSPAMAGDTIHLGTQGLDTDLDGVYDAPVGHGPGATMLSLIWNKASGLVRSSLMRPARPQAGTLPVPVVMSSPSIAEDRVFVGVRTTDSPATAGTAHGYVSALAPWRVLLCDADRVIETTGSEPTWLCTGTASPQRTQSFVGEDVRRPFSRPAKATRLPTGSILVVDTGNHRVVEIDRAGRILWPLDLFGYEYYTSPDNHDLKLSRPADAHRYYDIETIDAGGTPRSFTVVHTVIADTGNARVIDVQTRFYDPVSFVVDGRQRHTVRRITPAYVRLGSAPRGATRVRYTSAQPIFDPINDHLIGYLCAASNLNQILVVDAASGIVNPMASVYTPGGSPGARWRYWAWLYDADPTDADHVSNEPLQFENIKHVEYRRYGSAIYLTVTCSRYRGRALPGAPDHPLAAAGPGVFEFVIDISDPNPDNWALHEAGSGAPWPTDDPHWYFTAADYRGRPMTTITTAMGTPQQHDYVKRWYPVCGQRLRTGQHLIVNSLSMIESATQQNIGAGVAQAVLGSHIFQVTTNLNVPADPTDDVHVLDDDRSVPAPGQLWADPLTQVAYAEVR